MATDYETITLPIAYNSPGQRVGGVNKLHEPINWNGSFTPNMKNMVVEGTRLRKRLGYTKLGSTSLPLDGTGMGIHSYVDAKGISHLIALTTTDAYKYNSSTNAWDSITPAAGDFSGSADNNFLTSLATDVNEFTNNGGTSFLITNGVEDIYYYEGQSLSKFVALTTGFTSFASTESIAEFYNHFFLINFTDTETHAKNFAFSVAGDIDDWTSSTSGEVNLTDSIGKLMRGDKLGLNLILYSENSITQVSYVGGTLIFSNPTIIYETGLFSNRSIQSLTNVHYFIGTDQRIYRYRGGLQIDDIGLLVSNDLFKTLNNTNKSRIVTGHDVNRHKVYFAYPQASQDYAKSAYILNYTLDGMPWEYYEFANSIRGMALYTTESQAYCDEDPYATYYCDEVSFYCDDSFGESGFPSTVFIDEDANVFTLDETTGQDNTSDIDCLYETEDILFDPAESYFRTIWISFEAKADIASSTVDLAYSIDCGKTWTDLVDSPVSLTGDWTINKLPLDVNYKRIRFRFRQTSDKDFQIRGVINIGITSASDR